VSADVALKAMFDRFLSRFALPLVRGGEVLLVSFPIGPGALEFFEEAVLHDRSVAGEILLARQLAMRDVVPDPELEALDADDVRLLAALHNVLLCDHEDLVGGPLGKNRWTRCLGWARETLEKVPPCTDAEQALRRHSMLHLAPDLTRQDVLVRSRSGVKRYAGHAPPRSALFWPKLRRITTGEVTAPLPEAVTSPEARALLTEVMERSPLTCLLSMPYGAEGSVHQTDLRWTPSVVAALSRQSLCRAVTYRHLELGLRAVGPVIARATAAGLEQAASSGGEDARQLLAFGLRYLVNLNLTHIATASDNDLLAPVRAPWEEADAPYRGLFFGWLVAALSRADRIGAPEPPNLALDIREKDFIRAASTVAGGDLEAAARHVDWLVPPPAQVSALQGG
jgi:hypothetical protein